MQKHEGQKNGQLQTLADQQGTQLTIAEHGDTWSGDVTIRHQGTAR